MKRMAKIGPSQAARGMIHFPMVRANIPSTIDKKSHRYDQRSACGYVTCLVFIISTLQSLLSINERPASLRYLTILFRLFAVEADAPKKDTQAQPDSPLCAHEAYGEDRTEPSGQGDDPLPDGEGKYTQHHRQKKPQIRPAVSLWIRHLFGIYHLDSPIPTLNQ